jgi:CDP-2,3-bis-(O-geranylgeranyl)-sn-glycerol synthase
MADPLLLLRMLLLLGVANGVPVLATKLCKNSLAAPLDGGLKFLDGRALFGASKTLRGVVASIVLTSLVGVILGFEWSLVALLAGLSMLGDLASSFVKRRMGLEVHAQAFGLDQIPEALLPLLVLQDSFGLALSDVFFVVLAFVLLGFLLSRVLYKMGIREQPY